MSKTCVKVTFEMNEEQKPTVLLVSNDEQEAKKFWEAVSKIVIVGDPNTGVGSPRYCAFHEEKV